MRGKGTYPKSYGLVLEKKNSTPAAREAMRRREEVARWRESARLRENQRRRERTRERWYRG